MKKSILLDIVSSLIVVVLVVLGFKLYDNKVNAEENTKTYALSTYNIDIPNFSYVNSVIANNKVYILYNNDDYYLLKEIDNITNKENTYSYNISSVCKLQNENNYPYIYCSNNDSISIYNTRFKKIINQNINSNYNYAINTNSENLNFKIIDNINSYEYINGYYKQTNNEYISLDTPYVKDAYCTDKCLLVRYNDITEMISLYEESELLETNIAAYQKYENGIYTYNNSKIKIYNFQTDEYKEFNSPINDLLSTEFTLGSNDYYLYVLNDNIINVYNLYNSENFTNINTYKVEEEIEELVVDNNYLYLYGTNTLYIYDISDIESNLVSSANYENDLIKSKIDYYQENYNVTINLTDNPTYLSSNYNITTLNNYNEIIDVLEDLERYFLVFNKEFFSRFSNYGMDGLEIYLVDSITNNTRSNMGNASVVGLYINKNNKYNIVISVDSEENITTIAYHETMHAIEDYLQGQGVTFSNWNNLNPDDFTYSNVYYTNQTFTDTLNNNKYSNAIYFVDNYARSNALEDRARMFEYLCQGEDFNEYPHLNNKINYIKRTLLNNFPELYSSSYFI